MTWGRLPYASLGPPEKCIVPSAPRRVFSLRCPSTVVSVCPYQLAWSSLSLSASLFLHPLYPLPTALKGRKSKQRVKTVLLEASAFTLCPLPERDHD